ncbi:MAG: hypothetical protein LBD70_08835 [Bifidobacteriaceae bacterium]|jgi:hypothetical protein|nr:hypothetical protein [Bifidobacteriaceae bacterium]
MPPGYAPRRSSFLAAAVGLALALALGGCGEQAKKDVGEALTGQNKIAAGAGAALEAELGIVAKEVAGWYTTEAGDPKIEASGGAYYICAAASSDCAATGTLIAPALDGVQISLARSGAATWCVQAGDGAGQTHISADAAQAADGPC